MRFLSDEYMAAATSALAGHAEITAAADQTDLSLQFVVTDPPGEDTVHYYLKIGGGAVEMARGELEAPDVRITNSYETAAKLAREEIKDQIAFLTGKLKVAGNMARLMANMSTFNQIRSTLKNLDIEY